MTCHCLASHSLTVPHVPIGTRRFMRLEIWASPVAAVEILRAV